MNIEYTPIFFPTKVAIIDDDPEYLAQVSLLLDDHLACHLFTSPSQALEKMQPYKEKNAQFAAQCANQVATNLNSDQPEDHTDNLHGIVNDEQRFDRFSVMVVDYAMPEMSGIDLCQLIRDPWMKKILITGKAGSQVAVQAFNEGVIDYFIQKEEPDVDVRLNAAINNLTRQYFTEMCVAKNSALKDQMPYLFDISFVLWFKQLCRQHNIIEFYLKKNELLSEFMLVNKAGEIKYLFVQTPEQSRAQYEVELANKQQYVTEVVQKLDHEETPKEVLDELSDELSETIHIREELLTAIQARKIIPYFAGQSEYDDSYKECWRDHVYAAQLFTDYAYALVDATESPGFDRESEVFSYDRFLKNFYSGLTVN